MGKGGEGGREGGRLRLPSFEEWVDERRERAMRGGGGEGGGGKDY